MSFCAICGVNRGGRPGGPAAALRRKQARASVDGAHSKDTEMEARVSTNISLSADTDIAIKTTAQATWIEFGSAAVFADVAQLRRLNAILTDYLKVDLISHLRSPRTIASDLAEDR